VEKVTIPIHPVDLERRKEIEKSLEELSKELGSLSEVEKISKIFPWVPLSYIVKEYRDVIEKEIENFFEENKEFFKKYWKCHDYFDFAIGIKGENIEIIPQTLKEYEEKLDKGYYHYRTLNPEKNWILLRLT